jgi:N utilization substance protein A
MKTEFMVAITQLSAEKNLSKEVVLAAVESALVSAYRKNSFALNKEVSVKISPSTGVVKVYVQKTVAEELTDPANEISLSDAHKIDKNVKIGDIVNIEATPPDAGRIAAQTARQVILQRLHEAEHHAIYEEFTCREGEVVSGIIQRITHEQIFIDLGKAEAILPVNEQVHNERYRVGQRLKVYLLEVIRGSKGPQIVVSRSHRNLLRRLFELEVPEIHGGLVDIKGVAREAGYRSKVAVAARQDGIDPVGCCVGLRGIRIQNIVSELNDEKIDVVQWVDDPKFFISNALSPAQVANVELNEEDNTALVAVPDKQLSLAIGKEGQNARLAARLTGWRIDIKNVSAVEAERVAERELAAQATKEVPGAEAVIIGTEAQVTGLEGSELDVEVVVEAVETVAEVEPAEELVLEEAVEIEEEVQEEEEEEEVVLTTDYELVFASEIAAAKKPTVSQIRFAEDILPSKAGSGKKKRKGGKKGVEIREKDLKVKKARPTKTVSYEGDEEEY